MARETPSIWQCEHHYPIEVVSMESGRRARCLGCGTCGPVREGSEERWGRYGQRRVLG
jgi:hypothetical protein